ncbi:MAG: alpha/beta fold hydrolase [Mariprofundaceae bacterium]|nr:alpha/beta fold hydrolase [Mariprofundaceae bacterium]
MSLPPMVLLHGWGQSARCWHAQVGFFSSYAEVTALNLPGHGGAPDAPPADWEKALLAAMPAEPVLLVGWSLGGMLAMRLALSSPQRVAGLVLVGATPCFRTRPDWVHGCADDVFERFRSGLGGDSDRLLGRFFALILQGDKLERRAYLDMVRSAVDRRHPASRAGLEAGLELLSQLDLRAEVADISVPTLLLHGEHDAVTPPAASDYLASEIHGAHRVGMPSGHAPHLTCAQQFNAIVEEWCLNNISTRGM